MRIKAALSSPFNVSKVLLPVPADVATISQLKKHIRQSLSTVSACSGSWREIKLEVEGFELLGGSGIDVIQDGDVVTVGLYPGSSKAAVITSHVDVRKASSKRKTEEEQETRGKKRKVDKKRAGSATVKGRKGEEKSGSMPADPVTIAAVIRTTTAPEPLLSTTAKSASDPAIKRSRPVSVSTASSTSSSSPSPSSSSSSSSSSTSSASTSSSSSSSTSSSSSSASSSSSSSSSSDSDSSSESEAPEQPHSAPQLPPTNTSLTPTSVASPINVPPGQGKAETHDRNARRRRARQYKLAAKADTAQPITTPSHPTVPGPPLAPLAASEISAPARAASAVPSIPASLSSFVSSPSRLLGQSRPSPAAPAGVYAGGAGGIEGTGRKEGNAGTETRQDVVMPSAVLNRNKKKGFLKDMMGLQRVRTTFGPNDSFTMDSDSMPAAGSDTGDAVDESIMEVDGQAGIAGVVASLDGSPHPTSSSTPKNAIGEKRRTKRGGRKSTGWKGNEVVPPSEREAVGNLFVTSKVFEIVRRDAGERYEQEPDDVEDAEDEVAAEQTQGAESIFGNDVNGAVGAPASGVGDHSVVVPISGDVQDDPYEPTPNELAWRKVEIAFEVLEPLTAEGFDSCKVGSTLAWKDVALNMLTFTPEIELHIGKITAVDAESSSIRLALYKRAIPTWDEEEGIDAADAQAVEEDEPVEVIITRDDLLSSPGKWKVVPNIMALALSLT